MPRIASLAALSCLFGLCLFGFLCQEAVAHDVPIDVTVQAFVHPEGGNLRVVVRVPLEAMQEVPFPTYGPGLLDLGAARASGVLSEAALQWLAHNIELYEDGHKLRQLELRAVRVSLPSDLSFASYTTALAHTTGELLPVDTQIAWRQAMLDVFFETEVESDDSQFAVRPNLGRLGMNVVTALRFVPKAGAERAYLLKGNTSQLGDSGKVILDPRWYQAARRFVELGTFHILGGMDHLLFLVCLAIPLRSLRQLAVVATSFTVAHSMTLIAAALGFVPDALWFPTLVELLIAVSIVYMALENIVGAKLERRWLIAFGFGLVHGFGFSFALADSLQFAGSHLLTSLLSFNLGVELGQVLVLVVLVPTLSFLFRRLAAERTVEVLLSALVAHTGWHWMTERGATLAAYRVPWPWMEGMPASAVAWLGLLVILAALLSRGIRRLRSKVGATHSAATHSATSDPTPPNPTV